MSDDRLLGEGGRECWREFPVRFYINCIPSQIILGEQVKKNLIGRACRKHGKR
jgi:hypothetical protein